MLRKAKPVTPAGPTAPSYRSFSLFGQSVTLRMTGSRAGQRATEKHLRTVCEPLLTSAPLETTGTALDIGAGTGAFAVPFAMAFPGWTVWCFEPDPTDHAALVENIAKQGLKNIHAVNLAVGAEESEAGNPALTDALLARDASYLQKHCPMAPLSAREKSDRRVRKNYPTLSADVLQALEPNLLNLNAAGAEADILKALGQGRGLSHVLGLLETPVPTRLLTRGMQNVALPVRSDADLALRRWPEQVDRRAGLDVVVAMYNTLDYIQECVDGLVDNTAEEVHVLVVDDGSTDGCGDFVAETYADNPRVRLLRKPNGGCASARNYGRLNSDATHIAFVDADDLIDGEMFPELLELARYTGAEVVQGGFDFLHMEEDGSTRLEDSYEQSAAFRKQYTHYPFGGGGFCRIPAKDLMVGQPTIWRRIYRRDFLDNRDIWFPEHIRAFDDQIFQMLTLHYGGDIPAVDHVRYHYRQHPGQDIKQGDERFFYSLEMFRMMVKRGIREGWNDFRALGQSFVNTVNWIHGGLRPDLKPEFLRGAAELWALMGKTLGYGAFGDIPLSKFNAPDFQFHVAHYETTLRDFHTMYAWIYLDGTRMHAPLMKMPNPTDIGKTAAQPPRTAPDPVLKAIEALGGTPLNTIHSLAGLPFVHPNSSVILATSGTKTGRAYLDGIVDKAAVGLSKSTAFPFTGTHWTLRQGIDGTWLLINQNEIDHCLALEGTELQLQPHEAGQKSRSTRWHLFQLGRGFGICSVSGMVLHVANGKPCVSPATPQERARELVWTIEAAPAKTK